MSEDVRSTFAHPAFFYRGPHQYVAQLVPFVQSALAAGEPVAVAVPGPNLDLLHAALGTQASAVRWWDMREVGRNPGRILGGVLRTFADAHQDQRVRIVGEPVWPERSDLEYPACVEHEALINPAFAGRAVTIVCPYDADRLPARVLADAQVTHPVLWDGDGDVPSERFDWEHAVRIANQRMAEPLAAQSLRFDRTRLRSARSFTAAQARRSGLDPTRIEDVVLAVNELATNSIEHGGGTGLLRIWTEPEYFGCEVVDSGILGDRLAGRGPSSHPELGGYGLLLLHGLADLVRTHITSTGTTIRAYFRRQP